MNIPLLHILTLLMLSVQISHAQLKGDATLMSGSIMVIKGNSNVNDFACKLTRDLEKRRISFQYLERGDVIQFSQSALKVAVKQFDCGNKYISNDMHQTLKADQFPLIEMELLAVDLKAMDLQMIVTIAGNSKSFQIPFTLSEEAGRVYKIGVCKDFNMTDFGIAPPKTMMGLIVVNDQISIELELFLDLDM